MTDELRIHDGTRGAHDFRRLREQLRAELDRQADALRERAPGSARDLDRDALRAVFDSNGFAGEYFELDFGAPVGEFVFALAHVIEDVLVDWEMLVEAYPSGVADLSDAVPADLPDGWHPDD